MLGRRDLANVCRSKDGGGSDSKSADDAVENELGRAIGDTGTPSTDAEAEGRDDEEGTASKLIREATLKPVPMLSDSKVVLSPSTVPLITPESKPKRKPPRVAMTVMRMVNAVLFWGSLWGVVILVGES